LLLVFPPLPAHAWSEGGHHLISVLAFRQLPKAKQDELIRILKAHPRFGQDFKLPKDVRNADEWLIGRAGYWPDVARSQPEYNRPNWHYQLGTYLNVGKVEPPKSPGPLPADATLATKELHIAQALELCTKVFADKSKPDSDRAIAICWIAHLVADSHQPCHAGSLYVEGLFPEGDRGANSIKTKQSKNMHALWDGLLGPKWDEADINRRVTEVPKVVRSRPAPGEITLHPGGIEEWLNESISYATQYVYTSVVMEPISVAVRSGSKELAELDLPESYLKEAGRVAKIRAAEAGARLSRAFAEGLTQK
jgi:S1/P1 Nuclease